MMFTASSFAIWLNWSHWSVYSYRVSWSSMIRVLMSSAYSWAHHCILQNTISLHKSSAYASFNDYENHVVIRFHMCSTILIMSPRSVITSQSIILVQIHVIIIQIWLSWVTCLSTFNIELNRLLNVIEILRFLSCQKPSSIKNFFYRFIIHQKKAKIKLYFFRSTNEYTTQHTYHIRTQLDKILLIRHYYYH